MQEGSGVKRGSGQLQSSHDPKIGTVALKSAQATWTDTQPVRAPVSREDALLGTVSRTPAGLFRVSG
jgi:hypothetical protein